METVQYALTSNSTEVDMGNSGVLARNKSTTYETTTRTRYICWQTANGCTSCGGNGFGGGGGGANPFNPVTPTAPPDVSPQLLAIVDVNNSNLTPEQWAELDAVFQQAHQASCLFRAMCAAFVANGKKFKWKTFKSVADSNGFAMFGYYNNSTKTIALATEKFQDSHIEGLSTAMAEEMFHAYQYLYGENANNGYMSGYGNGIGVPNIEFEAKFFVDLGFYLTEPPAYGQDMNVFQNIYNQEYESWLNEITNNRTQTPKNYNILKDKYFTFMQKFKTAHKDSDYDKPIKDSDYDKPIDFNKSPDALLNLINVSGCNN